MYEEIRSNLIDGHLHLSRTVTMSRVENVAQMQNILQEACLHAMCVQNIVLWDPRHLLRNPLSLLLKRREPARVFSFGGLRLPPPTQTDKHANYAAQAERLIQLGFDGVKMFGKPNIRRDFGEPFDSPVFDELYAALEEKQIPILFHLGDPRAFWDPMHAPAFARENGWVFTGPRDVPFEQQYEEMERLLTRFPRLRIVFAHFYFLADDLPRLRAFLLRWPSVRIDITPGTELYEQCSETPEQARAFFLEFQDRILFGTDNVGTAYGETFDPGQAAAQRIDTIWRFLTTDASVGWGTRLRGLSLPPDALERIAYRNFYEFVGREQPRSVDWTAAKAYAREMQQLALNAQDQILNHEFSALLQAYDTE